jgi:predicted ATPase
MGSQVAPGGLVGRAGELARLEAAMAAAAAGRGGTVLVAGDAGIGKTRLADELAERALRGGATVLRGRCIDLVGTGLPYLPLVEALRPLHGSPLLGEVPGGLGELARLLPELAAPADADPPAGVTDSQLRLFEESLAVLERLGEGGRPLLLVLEDLHWADASTLDLVAFLAHAVPSRRILIVATYRSDELRPHDPLPRVAGELRRARAATLLELGPLPQDAVELLVARRAGGETAELASAISARSEGNPFYAEELLAAALGGEQLPRALHDLLLQRIARLDAGTRLVLRVAAAAGRDVPYRLLAAVVDLPEPRLLAALQQAVEHGVLVPDQPAGAFRFRHALLAEAVYATLLPGEREAVHGRLARALAEVPGLGATPAATGELAQHWAAAGRPVEALAASVRAATRRSPARQRRCGTWSGRWRCGSGFPVLRSWWGWNAWRRSPGRRSSPSAPATPPPPRRWSAARSGCSTWTPSRCASPCCTSGSAPTCSRRATARAVWPRSGARPAWCPPSRPPPSGRGSWRRSATG